jgi:hypothetical protein
MPRYIMTQKIYERFKTLEYDLNCKICACPILPGDEVESKAGGSGPKLYHAQCYDDSHIEIEYTEEKLANYDMYDLINIVGEFDVDEEQVEGMSREDLIDLILLLELEWIQNQKG